MNDLPAEILLLIGLTDQETYRGMLAIPKFVRVITIGYRLTAMEKFGFNFEKCWMRDEIEHIGGNIPYFSIGGRTQWKEKCIQKDGQLYIRFNDIACIFDRGGACRFRDTCSWTDGLRKIYNVITNGNKISDIYADGRFKEYNVKS